MEADKSVKSGRSKLVAGTGFATLTYSCLSFFKDGQCPRAHKATCPFVIKGKDYSNECMYSKVVDKA